MAKTLTRKEAVQSAGHYLCGDEDSAIEQQVNLIAAHAEDNPDDLIDNVEDVLVWEKVVGKITCQEFLEMIGWDLVEK